MAERIDYENWDVKVIKEGNEFKLIETNDNSQRVFGEVYCDLGRSILNDIVTNVNYKVNFKDKEINPTDKLPDGSPRYVNLKRRIKYTKHGLDYMYEGTEVVVPELAYIIQEFIQNEDVESLQSLFDYKHSNDLISIDNQISGLNTIIDSLDNFNFNAKMHALKSLKELCEKKKAGQYFDAELLQDYYLEAMNSISFVLKSEESIIKSHFIKCNNRIRDDFFVYELSDSEYEKQMNESIKSGLIPNYEDDIFVREGYGALVGFCPSNCSTIEDLTNFTVLDFNRNTVGKPTIKEKIKEIVGRNNLSCDPYYNYNRILEEGYDLVIGPGGFVNGENWDKAVYCRNYEDILEQQIKQKKK